MTGSFSGEGDLDDPGSILLLKTKDQKKDWRRMGLNLCLSLYTLRTKGSSWGRGRGG